MKKQHLCAMVDCSRNAVMKPQRMKSFIDILAKMGYNSLMLYTEDTYEVENQPYFGYLRGRYTKEELKDLDAYAEQKGIELIPCIQTLAHLNQIFHWNVYQPINDIDDILLIDDEQTYTLIDDMFRSLRASFKTDLIHIGMDEAGHVGLGKYLRLHGSADRFELISRHLEKVVAIAKKYGFKPMMWSDMFFRLATGGDYYCSDPAVIKSEIADLIPDDVSLVYWDYYSQNKVGYDDMIKAHFRLSQNIWFAGGAWTWTGFSSRNRLALAATEPAMKSCFENDLKNVIITLWGDDGSETSMFSALPALFYAAELYRGNFDFDDIKEKFRRLFDISFDDFCLLDIPSQIRENADAFPDNVDKILLYNDPFLGNYDFMISDTGKEKELYEGYAEKLRAFSDHAEYGYMFQYSAALCELLSVKADLGKRTRKAYTEKDVEALKNVCLDYKKAISALDDFYLAFRKRWLTDNKGNGFEVQDIRIGGLRLRLVDCAKRLIDYIENRIEGIEELDEPIINGEPYYELNDWKRIASPNALTFF